MINMSNDNDDNNDDDDDGGDSHDYGRDSGSGA